VSEERKEIFVNIGYRISVLGFLACDEPKIDGNFGFKDQWLALLWVSENIASFGGKFECMHVHHNTTNMHRGPK
jgi:carboxylesterase type B